MQTSRTELGKNQIRLQAKSDGTLSILLVRITLYTFWIITTAAFKNICSFKNRKRTQFKYVYMMPKIRNIKYVTLCYIFDVFLYLFL